MLDIQSRDRLSRRLALYSMAAGGMLVSTGATARVVSIDSDLIGFTLTVNEDFQQQDLDIDGNGMDDFRVTVQDGFTDRVLLEGKTVDNQVLSYAGCAGDVYAGNLAAGTVVPPPGATFNQKGVLYSTYGTSCSLFDPNTTGYVGLKFLRNGSLRYAWMKVRVDALSSHTFTIEDGAYESQSNTSITVGAQPTPIDPEPVPAGGLVPTAAGLLALGAIMLRRRKRDLGTDGDMRDRQS